MRQQQQQQQRQTGVAGINTRESADSSIARRFRPAVKEPVPGPKGQGFDPRRRSPSVLAPCTVPTVPTVHGCDRSAPGASGLHAAVLYGNLVHRTVQSVQYTY